MNPEAGQPLGSSNTHHPTGTTSTSADPPRGDSTDGAVPNPSRADNSNSPSIYQSHSGLQGTSPYIPSRTNTGPKTIEVGARHMGLPPTPLSGVDSLGHRYPMGESSRMGQAPTRSAGTIREGDATDYSTSIERKQYELQAAVQSRLSSLEQMVEDKEEEMARLQGRLRSLEDDYQFNYNLITERDAALDEASAQLQRLYRELKATTAERDTLSSQCASVEAEVVSLRQRVRDVEMERESSIANIQKEHAVKERHLMESLKAREAACEEDIQTNHAHYLNSLREAQSGKTEVEDRLNKSAELQAKHQHQYQKLQAELELVQNQLRDARESLQQRENQAQQRERALELRQEESRASEMRLRSSIEEYEQRVRELEAKLSVCQEQLDRSLAIAENAIREESQKCTRAEMEKTAIHAELTDAQQRIQRLASHQAQEEHRHGEEVSGLQDQCTALRSRLKDVEGRLHDSERTQQLAIQTYNEEKNKLESRLTNAEDDLRKERQLRESIEMQSSNQKLEIARLMKEVQRRMDDESHTATKARSDVTTLEARVMELQQALQESRGEVERMTRKNFESQERFQTETARLSRELHASEAARRTLDEQYQLMRDHNAQEHLICGLRYDKESLERQVVDLQRTNEEIRLQVSNFTMELQNDPVLKSAKETQQKVQALQQELLTCRADCDRLKDSLRAKEDDLSRAQMELLQAGRLPGAIPRLEAPAGSDTTTNNANTNEAILELRAELTSMRRAYEGLLRRAKTDKDKKPRPHSRCEDSSETCSSAEDNSRTPLASHGTQRVRGASPKANNAPVDLPETHPDAAYMVQEAEVWRRKCLQLEHQLRLLLRERDQLRHEADVARQDAAALAREKQSLLDLNSMLKAQLREAFRSAAPVRDSRTAASTRDPPIESNAGGPAQSGSNNTELLAAAALALLDQRRTEHSMPLPTTSGDANTRSMRGHPPSPSGLNKSRSASAAPTLESPSVNRPKPAQSRNHQRHAELDDEIESMQARLRSNSTKPQAPSSSSASPSPGSGAATRPIVVRRGTTSVRHYGYQD